MNLRQFEIKPFDKNSSLSQQQLYRGFDFYNKKQYKNAVKCYSKGIELAPKNKNGDPVTPFIAAILCDLYYCRGLAYYGDQNYDYALKDFSECIKYKPELYLLLFIYIFQC